MIGVLPGVFPFALPRLRLRTLALAGFAGPAYLSAEAATTNPTLTGAVILSTLLVFGTFVLSRWRMLLMMAPIWIVLMAQAGHPVRETPHAAAVTEARAIPVEPQPSLRPIARPWG